VSTWELFVAAGSGLRQAMIDVYLSAEIVAKVNDISTWRVTLPTDTDAGRVFLSDTFARLEVVVDGVVWRSGPMVQLKREVDLDGDTLEISGVDDTVWLARRNAHPQPADAGRPPYTLQANDVHTGDSAAVLAELVRVNAGPSAAVDRRVPGLAVPVPPATGGLLTVSARWQNLLTLLQDTARPLGLLFDVVDLSFRVYASTNRGAIFSQGLETLGGWVMTAASATVNMAAVAGGGEGTARIIREIFDRPSIATWGLAETFVDQRQTVDLAELDKAGREAVAAGVKPVTVTFTPLDTEGQTFGRDWTLGDTVTVKAGDLTVVDQIREIHVTLGNTVTLVPSVGSATGDLALFRKLATLDQRVRQLERI